MGRQAHRSTRRSKALPQDDRVWRRTARRTSAGRALHRRIRSICNHPSAGLLRLEGRSASLRLHTWDCLADPRWHFLPTHLIPITVSCLQVRRSRDELCEGHSKQTRRCREAMKYDHVVEVPEDLERLSVVPLPSPPLGGNEHILLDSRVGLCEMALLSSSWSPGDRHASKVLQRLI